MHPYTSHSLPNSQVNIKEYIHAYCKKYVLISFFVTYDLMNTWSHFYEFNSSEQRILGVKVEGKFVGRYEKPEAISVLFCFTVCHLNVIAAVAQVLQFACEVIQETAELPVLHIVLLHK